MCLNDPKCILNPYPKVPESSCVYRYGMTTWQLWFFCQPKHPSRRYLLQVYSDLTLLWSQDMVCCQHSKNGILNLSNEGKSRYASMPSFIYRLFDISALASFPSMQLVDEFYLFTTGFKNHASWSCKYAKRIKITWIKTWETPAF